MNPENTPETTPVEQKPNSIEALQKKWLMYGGGGLTLVGLGLCLFGEAVFLKHSVGASTISWLLYGTISLVVFNAGLAIFGQAVVIKSQIDYKKNRKKFGEKRYGNKKKSGDNYNRSRKPRATRSNPRTTE